MGVGLAVAAAPKLIFDMGKNSRIYVPVVGTIGGIDRVGRWPVIDRDHELDTLAYITDMTNSLKAIQAMQEADRKALYNLMAGATWND
jgi:hypothetical protein